MLFLAYVKHVNQIFDIVVIRFKPLALQSKSLTLYHQSGMLQ